MKLIHKLPVFLLLILPLTLSGQKRWTLEECIRYAWENNLRIKQQELAIEQGKNNVVQAKYAFAPTVSGSLSHNMNWGVSSNVQILERTTVSQSTGMSVRASVDIYEGNKKINDLKDKEVNYEIAMQNAIKMKNDISLEISKSFLQVLLSRDILASAKSSLSSIQAQADRSKKLVDAGSQAYGPYLEITAQLAREKVQVVNAENQLRANLLSLKQLLDLPGDSEFDIAVPSVNLDNLSFMGESVDNVYTAALGLPQIKSSELSYSSSKIQLKLAQGRHLPTLSISAGYGTNANYSDNYKEEFLQQLKDNRNTSVGFSLSVPIFTAFSIKTGVKNAKLGIIKSEIDLKNTQQALYKEIQQVVNDASSQYAQMKASAENVKAMEESFRYVQQKFDIGAANATDYTVAKTNLFKAQSDLLQSKYQLLFQMKVLDFYKGKPISL